LTTSGTYAFNPSLGDLVLYAFGMCGVRRTAVLQEHMQDARMAANLVLADWSLKGINLWQVDKVVVPLVQGVGVYALDPSVIVMLDTYVTASGVDRIILPVSRTEYASYPNKSQQGFPATFWMSRTLSPVVSIWPVPDGNESSLTAYVLKQAQDAEFINGQQVAVPVAWVKAFASALAAQLAISWAPDRLAFLAPAAEKDYNAASSNNVETAQQYISPQISGYFR
jgi:hypothetical protein